MRLRWIIGIVSALVVFGLIFSAQPPRVLPELDRYKIMSETEYYTWAAPHAPYALNAHCLLKGIPYADVISTLKKTHPPDRGWVWDNSLDDVCYIKKGDVFIEIEAGMHDEPIDVALNQVISPLQVQWIRLTHPGSNPFGVEPVP